MLRGSDYNEKWGPEAATPTAASTLVTAMEGNHGLQVPFCLSVLWSCDYEQISHQYVNSSRATHGSYVMTKIGISIYAS